MITLDVCIEAVFTHLPAEERIRAAAGCGCPAIEFWLHDATFNGSGFDTKQPKDAESIRKACAECGVAISNMVVNPPDDGSFGGAPTDAGTHEQFLKRVAETIAFAQAAGCNRAIVCSGDLNPEAPRAGQRTNLVAALEKAAALAADHDFFLLLEPLNVHVDHPGYFLQSSQEGAEIVRTLDNPNLRLLFDVYHMQIMEGNLLSHIESCIDVVGHFHSAGVPGRGEHFNGELNYPGILRGIEELGYDGHFGLEYFPGIDDHAESLTRVLEHLRRR